MDRYVVEDATKRPRGFRATLDEAIDFADALPPPRAPRPVKHEPKTVTAPAMSDAQISHDVDLHIRQIKGQARRIRRASIIQPS